jgi:phytoene desaturase
MYAGLSPDSALALYAVITYMDTIEGVWFPEGGMHAVPMIMAQVAEKAGVNFRYGDSVETILRSPTGRLAGVRTSSGARIMADAVVCTVDLPTASTQLLGDLRPPRAASAAGTHPRRWFGTSRVRPTAALGRSIAASWGTARRAIDTFAAWPSPMRL